MTAGSGVIHSELPEREFAQSGGRLHGFQLWVNLPQRDKMIRPRYQEIPGARIPTAESADGLTSVKVIAGESLGSKAMIETRTPIIYLHFKLKPTGKVLQSVPANYNAFAYVVNGEGQFGVDRERATRGQMVMFSNDGDDISIENTSNADLEFLLIAGVPLGEPIARYGPFVMNTRAEIHEAVEDYQNGRMGVIRAET
jgi:redox-sensitive bicupin YhaK (pirin superfamily)